MTQQPGSARSNVKWVGLSQAGRVIITFVATTVFARLLPASDFGLLAMAMIVTNFAGIIRDLGTSAALVQRNELNNKLLDTVFWLNIIFGAVSGGFIAAGSPLIAASFGEPSLQGILVLLALAFPIGASSSAHLALLERAHRFRAIAIAEIATTLVGASTGIYLAMIGTGVMSLVAQTLITTVLSTIAFWSLSNWRPKFNWSNSELKSLFSFSANLVGFNLINYFSRNVDSIIIGRFLGPLQLGLYSVAYRIMLFPLQNLTFVISRAFLPIFSRQQDDLKKVSDSYLSLLGSISLITAPLMFGLWAVREPFVDLVLGPKWADSAPIIFWLAPTGYIQSLVSTTGMILTATAQTALLRNLGAATLVIYISSFAIGIQYGIMGLAEAYFFANLFAGSISLYHTMSSVELHLRGAVVTILRPTTCALTMAVIVSLLAHSNFLGSLSSFLKLLITVPSGVVVYVALAMYFIPNFREKLKLLYIKASP